MIRTLIIAAVLTCGAATAQAQCPNCKPQAPTVQAPQAAPQYVWVRRGLFRCRWVLTPVYPMQPVQVIGVAR